jgi:hypothetical protein
MDTSRTTGRPLDLLLQGVGRRVDGGLLIYSGAACETLRPSVLEDARRTSSGHLEDLWAPPWHPPAGGWEAGGWWPPILGCRL